MRGAKTAQPHMFHNTFLSRYRRMFTFKRYRLSLVRFNIQKLSYGFVKRITYSDYKYFKITGANKCLSRRYFSYHYHCNYRASTKFVKCEVTLHVLIQRMLSKRSLGH
jgi:hypothetical protein